MHYFEEHLPSEERNAIPYLSTTVQFLDYISDHYGDSIALSDQNQAVSYFHRSAAQRPAGFHHADG